MEVAKELLAARADKEAKNTYVRNAPGYGATQPCPFSASSPFRFPVLTCVAQAYWEGEATPLNWAAGNGHLEVVKVLLSWRQGRTKKRRTGCGGHGTCHF